MKRFYSVLAQANDPETAKPLNNPHEEIIDLKENKLFKGVKTILQLKERYEEFWNRPTRVMADPDSETENNEEIVFVLSIREMFPHEYPCKIDAEKQMKEQMKNSRRRK